MGVGGQRHAYADLPLPKEPGTHCTVCFVGHRADLDGCGKCRPLPGFDPSTVHPVGRLFTAKCMQNFDRKRDHLQDLDVDGRVILKCILRYYVRIWTGLMLLGIGAICVLFWIHESTSEVFKSWIISWVGKRMLASNEEVAWRSYLIWWIRIIGNGETAACKAINQHVAVLRTFASLILPLFA